MSGLATSGDRWKRLGVALATLWLLAGATWSAVVGAMAAERLLADGRWLESWGGHLRLHLHDAQWKLPWSTLLTALLTFDAVLLLAPLALTLAVRSSGRRAALLAVIAGVAWGLAVPLERVGEEGWIDEPRSVDVHFLCTHPVEDEPPGLLMVSSSWFAGC